jgi:hypothetical protein
MKVTPYEATVENGQIKLVDAVRLPEHATVYVVLPGIEEGSRIHFRSPRLARPECAADFIKVVVEEPQDAGLR